MIFSLHGFVRGQISAFVGYCILHYLFQKRSAEVSPVKGKKEDKVNKKDLEKEKKVNTLSSFFSRDILDLYFIISLFIGMDQRRIHNCKRT